MSTSKERTLKFLKGESNAAIPFHPLVMQYAAQCCNIPFREYCLDYQKQCEAMINFSRSEDYGMDCVHPSGFPYCEAEEYGLEVVYPENNLPYPIHNLIEDFEKDIHLIRPLNIESSRKMMNRVEGVALYNKLCGDELFITGHCEGPFAEYCDLRGTANAFMDLYDYPDEVKTSLNIITENAKKWITLQIQAGCHAFSIGDAVCSQISEEQYIEFVLPFHKELIKHVHTLGNYIKFHICGDTTKILPHLIKAGANIIDVDHLVKNIDQLIPLLSDKQVLCGNIDPVSIIRFGTPKEIEAATLDVIKRTQNKCILSAGCEIPLGTPQENYKVFRDTVINYKNK